VTVRKGKKHLSKGVAKSLTVGGWSTMRDPRQLERQRAGEGGKGCGEWRIVVP